MKQISLGKVIILAGIFSSSSHALLCGSGWRAKADELGRKIRTLINEFKNDAPVYKALSTTVEPYAQELTMRKEEADEASTFVNSRFDEILKDIDDVLSMDKALDQALVDYNAQVTLLTRLLAAKQTELERKTVEYNRLVGDDGEKAVFLLSAINDLRNEYDNLTLQRAELIKKINALKTALEDFARAEESDKEGKVS